MESGDTTNTNTNGGEPPIVDVTPDQAEPTSTAATPTTAPAHDWKNYKSPKANHPQSSHSSKAKTDKNNGGLICAIVFAVVLGGLGLVFGVLAYANSLNAEQTQQVVSTDGYYSGNSIEFEETSIANIASKVTPAVVSIISSTYSTSYWGYGQSSQSAGTGMIVTSDGYVLTNRHVVEDATEIQIVTDDGDTYEDVDIVGLDPLNDVAYLKINNVSDLPTVTLGDSKTIAVGQPVLAIGNALGAYQNSVTQGIISGTGRSVAASDSDGSNVEYLSDMLQTDAAINSGNSGGPLVNAAGDVIGINTAVSSSGNGLGFAIPISATKGMLENIIENNKASRAYLGLTYLNITSDVAKQYNLSVKHGAYIYSTNSRQSAIVSGGPADQAGIKEGDIVTKVNGIEIGTAGSISTLVGEYKSGETIPLTILRDGNEQTINITLGEYYDTDSSSSSNSNNYSYPYSNR